MLHVVVKNAGRNMRKTIEVIDKNGKVLKRFKTLGKAVYWMTKKEKQMPIFMAGCLVNVKSIENYYGAPGIKIHEVKENAT
jgi:hypothetical protein